MITEPGTDRPAFLCSNDKKMITKSQKLTCEIARQSQVIASCDAKEIARKCCLRLVFEKLVKSRLSEFQKPQQNPNKTPNDKEKDIYSSRVYISFSYQYIL